MDPLERVAHAVAEVRSVLAAVVVIVVSTDGWLTRIACRDSMERADIIWITQWIIGVSLVTSVVILLLAVFYPLALDPWRDVKRASTRLMRVAAEPITSQPSGEVDERVRLEAERQTIAQASTVLDQQMQGAADAIMPGVFFAAREKAKQASCMSHLKQLCLAIHMYATDNDDRLPQAENWTEALRPYYRDEGVLRCPAFDASHGYAMNVNLSGAQLSTVTDPRRTVLLFDSEAGTVNAADAGSSLPTPPRHLERNVIAFVDGHVEAVPRGLVGHLAWVNLGSPSRSVPERTPLA